MIDLWRITQARYQDQAYSGEGARRYGGRFNSPGRAVVYTSGSLSMSVLELLANLDDYDPEVLKYGVPASIESAYVEELAPGELPKDWRPFPHGTAARRLGDRWLAAKSSLVLVVPSAVVPRERNYLINPMHSDMQHLVIGRPEPLEIDPRLVRAG